MFDGLRVLPERPQQHRIRVMDPGMIGRKRKGLVVAGRRCVEVPGAGEDGAQAAMGFGRVLVNCDRLREVAFCIVEPVGSGAYRAQCQQRTEVARTHREHHAEERLRVAQVSPILQLLGHLKGEFGPGLRLADFSLPICRSWRGGQVFLRCALVRPPFVAPGGCALLTLGSRAIDLERVQTKLMEVIYEKLQQLPGGEVLRMAYIEGKSTQEIACELKITENNVYIIKSRSLKVLRTMLTKNEWMFFLLLFMQW